MQILKGLRSRYEAHHKVRYADEALEAAAKLAKRHLRDYRLPDSAIDLIDEAGARLRMLPRAGRRAGRAPSAPCRPTTSRASSRGWRASRRSRPARRTASGCARIEDSLKRVVFGQDDAVRQVTAAIKRSRAGLGQPDRPAGCFLFTGPTGVGKTELAKQLAIHLGNEFIRFDMSEYMEKHAVARLIGAPPGLRRLRAGRPARRRRADAPVRGGPDGRDREGAPRRLQHPAAGDGPRDADRQHGPQGRLPAGRADPDLERRLARDERGARSASAAANAAGSRARRPPGCAPRRPSSASSARSSATGSTRSSASSRSRPASWRRSSRSSSCSSNRSCSERRVAITLEPEARAWLAAKGYDPLFGARPLARVIQTEVRDRLTDEILFGALEHGGTVADRPGRRRADVRVRARRPGRQAPPPAPVTA